MAFAHRSTATKRILREAKELAQPTYDYHAYPLEDNLFEWHFTIRGPSATEFEGGVYHGIIRLPPEYPMKPPAILFLTPNGRFQTNTRVCLSISDFHPESWQPAWTIRTVLVALMAFLPSPSRGAVGSIDCSKEERRKLARQSVTWTCPDCKRHPSQDLAAAPADRSAEDEEATRVAAQLVEEDERKAATKTDSENATEQQQQQQQSGQEATTTQQEAPTMSHDSQSPTTHQQEQHQETQPTQQQQSAPPGQQQPESQQDSGGLRRRQHQAPGERSQDTLTQQHQQQQHRQVEPPPDKWIYDVVIACLLAAIVALIVKQYLAANQQP
eukprot:m.13282 g.13282  ORF g.13282 m.13282 type:complete len:327 (-) comp7208_c0_seq1:106-1086(-)